MRQKLREKEIYVDIAFLLQANQVLQEKCVRLPDNCSPFLRAIAERIWENRRNAVIYRSHEKQGERRQS